MSDKKIYDVAVIGAGPAGYVAAIKAAQLGMQVVCIDERERAGGTCLNVGCIPSKALLNSSQKYVEASDHFQTHGIICQKVDFDLRQMMTRKDKIIQDFTQGIEGLFRKNKVTFVKGKAQFSSLTDLNINNLQGEQQDIEAKKIIIATGSTPIVLPNVNIDEKVVVTSTGALSLSQVPKHLIIIGGGYIGLEIGSVWRRLGADVTVIEAQDTIVPQIDKEISGIFLKSLKNLGIHFKLATRVMAIEQTVQEAIVKVQSASKEFETLTADVVMLSMGRKPLTKDLMLENAKVKLDDQGRIEVNSHFQTSNPMIYAIGDVIKGPMLAHKGEEEGIAVAEIIAGQNPHINYATIPSIIYTHPEIASVGKTEEQLQQEGIKYKCGRFPFLANSRAKVNGESEGIVKILACQKSDEILGVHIIHAEAGSMIAEAVVAMEYRASSEDLARICHAHPTVNEAIKEAAMATYNKAIHI